MYKILGLDSVPVKSNHTQIKYTLRAHFERINRIPTYKGIQKIFVPESNLANEASHMTNMIQNFPDVKTYWQKQDRPGVHKSHNVTDDYQFLFDSCLKNDRIYFDHQFFTCTKGKTEKEMKGMLREQLERYHFEYEEAHNIYGRPRQTITGKMGSGMQDDLAIATLMGPYWGRIILRDDKKLF